MNPVTISDIEGSLPSVDAFVRALIGGETRWVRMRPGSLEVLRADVDLDTLLRTSTDAVMWLVDVDASALSAPSELRACAPVDAMTEVWAAGVTYQQSREARVNESIEPDIYLRVYEAVRPELFFKSIGWRVRGPGETISVRADSQWNVPEPELAAVLRPDRSVFGWTICNDVSSRSIEGMNPLYLPQAKIYAGACAVGPAIVPADAVPDPYSLTITMTIERDGAKVWSGFSSTAQLRRRVDELASYLFASEAFPHGVVLSTGTSLVPKAPLTLLAGDLVRIGIEGVGALTNPVVIGPPDGR